MRTKRIVMQELDCNCVNECDGQPTPYPLYGVNTVGKHCLNQGKSNCNQNGQCRFLYWRTVSEIDLKKN